VACSGTGAADDGVGDTAHDHGDEHDDADEQPASALSLARLFDERLGVWNACRSLLGFLDDPHERPGGVAPRVDLNGETPLLGAVRPPLQSASVTTERVKGMVNAVPTPVPANRRAPR